MQSKTNLTPYLVIAILAFIIFIIIGIRLPPEIKTEMITLLQSSLKPLTSFGSIPLILLIFLNNTLKCFLTIVTGILFGLPSIVFICLNAVAIGALASYLGSTTGLGVVIASLAPHGIIEIPLLIISAVLGLSIGSETLKSLLKQKGQLKTQYIYSFKLFFKWMLPLFLVAALVEVLITPHIISLAGGATNIPFP